MLVNIEDIELGGSGLFRMKNEEDRKNTHEKVKHFIGCVFVIAYLFMVVINIFSNGEFTIHNGFENLVMIIIGYYFAKTLN